MSASCKPCRFYIFPYLHNHNMAVLENILCTGRRLCRVVTLSVCVNAIPIFITSALWLRLAPWHNILLGNFGFLPAFQ